MGSLAPTAAHTVKAQGVQTGTHRAGARTRQRHWVRGLEASSAPAEASKTPSSLGDPGRKRTSATQQAGWPPTREPGQICVRIRRSAISASCSVLTVCRLRSCHARAHCVARSQGLAMTPKNGYARAAGTQARAEHHRTAPTTMV